MRCARGRRARWPSACTRRSSASRGSASRRRTPRRSGCSRTSRRGCACTTGRSSCARCSTSSRWGSIRRTAWCTRRSGGGSPCFLRASFGPMWIAGSRLCRLGPRVLPPTAAPAPPTWGTVGGPEQPSSAPAAWVPPLTTAPPSLRLNSRCGSAWDMSPAFPSRMSADLLRSGSAVVRSSRLPISRRAVRLSAMLSNVLPGPALAIRSSMVGGVRRCGSSVWRFRGCPFPRAHSSPCRSRRGMCPRSASSRRGSGCSPTTGRPRSRSASTRWS